MSWRLAASLVRLRDQVNAAYPNRNKASDGTIGDTAHQKQGSASDHNPWVKDNQGIGVVTAFDITHDPANGCNVQAVADTIIESGDARVKYLIFNDHICVPADYGWKWVYHYAGSHRQHLHVSVYANKADEASDWKITKGAQVAIVQNAENWYGRLNKLHWQVRGRALDRASFNGLVGMDTLRVMEIYSDDPEADEVQNWQTVGKTAVNDKWDQQIYDLQASVSALKSRPTAEELQLIKDQASSLSSQLESAKRAGEEAQKRAAELEIQKIEAQKAGNAFTQWLGEQISKILKRG